jgi:hypothetical protein
MACVSLPLAPVARAFVAAVRKVIERGNGAFK